MCFLSNQQPEKSKLLVYVYLLSLIWSQYKKEKTQSAPFFAGKAYERLRAEREERRREAAEKVRWLCGSNPRGTNGGEK